MLLEEIEGTCALGKLWNTLACALQMLWHYAQASYDRLPEAFVT